VATQAETEEVLAYPLVRHADLSMDEAYRELQKKGPIRVQLPYGETAWLATRYDDCKVVYGDKRFSKAYGVGRDTPRMIVYPIAEHADSIANMDAPDHTRIRRLCLPAFSAKQMDKTRGQVEKIVDDALDEFEAAGPTADWEEWVAWTVPLRVITGILGVSRDDIPNFRSWVDDLVKPSVGQERHDEVLTNLITYVGGLIEERRQKPTDDLLYVLVSARDADDRLNDGELLQMALTLFLAGFETTAAQLGSMMWTLMAERRLWEELQADRSIMPAALEELWRWIPEFRHGWPMVRWTLEDVELSDGVVVPAGQAVIPEIPVANRDESVFPNGWEIDFHRENPMPHLSLALGAHRCLGAALAHQEIEVVLSKVLDRFPDLRLAIPAEDVEWEPETLLRTPKSLPLTW
jgi:cytochrome P450 RapN